MGQRIDLTQQVQGVLPEANGGAGPNIGLRFADAEVPSGSVDGSNKTFTLAFAPNPSLSLLFFVDKTLQLQPTDYTLSGKTITTTAAPVSGAVLTSWYRYLGFGQAQVFFDSLVLSDSVATDLRVARIPLGVADSMTLTDYDKFQMPPNFLIDQITLTDSLIIVRGLNETLSDTLTMTDSFAKTLA